MNVTLLLATEVLDSRGYPTVEVVMGTDTHTARAAVPSGKSTGRFEAIERRDETATRYNGKGVLGAVASVNDQIRPILVGRPLAPQAHLDSQLLSLDATRLKSRLGANAVLAVSLAGARLRAILEERPLFDSLSAGSASLLPVPCFNVINGGAHADNLLDFQEFMLVPLGLPTYAEALRAGAETYHTLGRLLGDAGFSTAVGDEGGFAPAIDNPEDALRWMMRAIEGAGYRPGEDICIALDPAATGFYEQGVYTVGGQKRDAAEMTDMYVAWVTQYPIVSIEDGLAEDDVEGWVYLTRTLGDRVQLVDDDIFVSDAMRVRAAAAEHIANAVLLKPNQIGTVTEIVETARVARSVEYRTMMSHRSGETDDSFIADLAVALETGQLKAGAPARGERVAKYNELWRIERALGSRARFAGPAAFAKPAGAEIVHL